MGLGVLGSGLWVRVLVLGSGFVVVVGDWGWRWVCGFVRCVGVRGCVQVRLGLGRKMGSVRGISGLGGVGWVGFAVGVGGL